MFEQLYSDPGTVARYRAAPLADERQRFLRHCADFGTSTDNLCRLARCQLALVDLLDLRAGGERVPLSRVEEAARQWSQTPGDQGYRSRRSYRRFLSFSVRWLRCLGWLEEPAVALHSHTAEVAAFADWMRDRRGLSESTIRGYCWNTDVFFVWLDGNGTALASVTHSDIDSSIEALIVRGSCSRTTIRIHAYRLRAFFRFAETQGWCRSGIAAGIMPPARYPDEPIPKGFDRNEVQRLLATTEGDRMADKRDRAILLLLATLGLRAGEVAALTIESIDWKRDTLHVLRPKTGRMDAYPLSPEVGNSLLRYILEARPQRGSQRALFLTLRAPIGPLKAQAVGLLVARRAHGLGIKDKRRGAHALRHAAAQRLVDEGLSMKEIGDFLGHRSPAATAVYAKVDLAALREVADFSLEDLTDDTA